jgi:hypothetical protein
MSTHRRNARRTARLYVRRPAHRRVSRLALGHARRLSLLCLLAAALAASGCATTHPPKLGMGRLSEAQTFPYFRLYWAGPRFAGAPLTAVDGRQSYNSRFGESIYYGDCAAKRRLGGGGSCGLPLQVTTVIYRLHSNAPLGAQRNALLRGVPATIYDNGRSIELYSGRLAIDVFSNTPAQALLAVEQLQPLNAPAQKADAALPEPVYCPGLTGPIGASLREALERLPGRPCQRAQAALAASGHPSQGPM